MQNFSTAVEGSALAIDSAGSAAKENSRYMESLESKSQAVKATFQQLSASVIDSGLVKAVLDLANGFLQLANTPIGTFVTQVTLLTGVLWGGTGLINAMKIIPNFLKGITVSLGTLGTTLHVAVPELLLLSAAIAGIVAISPKLVDWFKRYTDEAYEAEKELEKCNTQLAENKTRWEELNKIPMANRTTEIQDEISRLEEENEVLQDNIDKWNQQLILSNFEDKVNSKAGTVGKKHIVSSEGYGVYDVNANPIFAANEQEALNALIKEGLVEVANTVGKDAKQVLADLGYELAESEVYRVGPAYYKEILNELENVIGKINEGDLSPDVLASYTEYDSILKDIAEDAATVSATGGKIPEDIGAVLGEYEDIPSVSEKIYNSLYSVEDSLSLLNEGFALNALQVEQLEAKYPGISEALEETNIGFQSNTSSLGEMLAKMGEVNDEMGRMSEAYNALNSQTGATKAQVDSLASIFPGLTNAVKRNTSATYGVKDAYYIEAQALVDLAKTGNEWAIAMMKDQDAATAKQLMETKTRVKAMSHELSALIQSTSQAEEIRDLVLRLDKLHAEETQLENLFVGGYAETGGLIIPPTPGLVGPTETPSGGGSSSKGDSEKNKADAERKVLEERKKNYEKFFGFIGNKIRKEIEALEEAKEAAIKKYDDEISAIQKENEELEDQLSLQEALDALARARANKVLVFKDGKFQYTGDPDSISEAQNALERITREQEQKKRIEDLEKAKEAEQKSIDERIHKWEELEKQWAEMPNSWQEAQDKLNFEQILGTKLEGENWRERLDNLQSYVAEYNKILEQLDKPVVNEGSSEAATQAGMTAEDKARLESLSARWHTASSQAEKDALHAEAEAIRRKYGYSGGSAGNEYIRYARGTVGARGGMSLVGEQGPELRVLSKGDGILPADITRNLWRWGEISPSSVFSGAMNGLQAMGQKVGINIQNFNPNLPNVTDGESFVRYLKTNFWQDAMQYTGI